MIAYVAQQPARPPARSIVAGGRIIVVAQTTSPTPSPSPAPRDEDTFVGFPDPTIPLGPDAPAAPAGSASGGLPARGADGLLKRQRAGVLSAAQIDGLVAPAAAAYNVDPSLIKAIIEAESGFNPSATSPRGARGLMQLMPATASGLGVTDPYDSAQNVQGGTRLVRSLLDRFGGDQRLALAAYKVGPALVERYGGIPPTGDVQRYIDGILAAMQRYRGGLPLPPSLDVPASDAPAASPSPLPPWLDVPRM